MSKLVIPGVVASAGNGGGGGGSVTVDSELSTTSTNPVQNKIITAALEEKVNLTGSNVLVGTLDITNDPEDLWQETYITPGNIELNCTGSDNPLSNIAAIKLLADELIEFKFDENFEIMAENTHNQDDPYEKQLLVFCSYKDNAINFIHNQNEDIVLRKALYSNGTLSNIQNVLWDDGTVFKNKATGADSISILGNPATAQYATNIGYESNASYRSVSIGYYCDSGSNSIAAGDFAKSKGQMQIVLGFGATAEMSAQYAIQLGQGTNSSSKTLQVWNYQLLDGNTGKIPAERLPSIGGAPTITWYKGNTGTTVTIADTTNATLVKVYKNGLLLEPSVDDSDGSDSEINDYSISGTTLTLTTALVATDKIAVEVF